MLERAKIAVQNILSATILKIVLVTIVMTVTRKRAAEAAAAAAATATETTTISAASSLGTTGNATSTLLETLEDCLRKHLPTPPELPAIPNLDPNTAKIIWRDVFFLLLGSIVLSIISFVETYAMDADARYVSHLYHHDGDDERRRPKNPQGIIDTGYLVTYPLYEYLKVHRDVNDLLAGVNSLVLLLPGLYLVWTTVVRGDYSCVFRILAVQLLRSLCGWCTYLPPDPTYLNSLYDFPDFVHCLFRECPHVDDVGEGAAPDVLPFVSFFSGHVATLVVVGNHMALSCHPSLQQGAMVLHACNVLQIVRLLATRGHYSIDIIIGWYVAVYVSTPAGRLGRYYSRGATVREILPKTAQEAYERATGVADERHERRMSALMLRPDVQDALRALEQEEKEVDPKNVHTDNNVEDIQSDTTATILHEAASKLIREHAQNLQNDLLRLQERTQQWQQRTHKTMTAMTTHRPSNNVDDDNKDSTDVVSINAHKKDN